MQTAAALHNRYLFSQTDLDSGALTILGSVIHRFTEPGTYTGTVLRGRDTVGRFYLRVAPDCPATQVNIDLADLKPLPDDCAPDAGGYYVVGPMGYAVFHVSTGPGGFAVLVGSGGKEPGLVFDSRELSDGDIFTATILRPGAYSIINSRARTKGAITVAYPTPGKGRYQPGDAVPIECTAKGFAPDAVKLGAAQTQVYYIKAPSRLKIELVKPDDGPKGPATSPLPGWRKPAEPAVQRKPAERTLRRKAVETVAQSKPAEPAAKTKPAAAAKKPRPRKAK